MKITHSLDHIADWFFATLEKLLQTRETVIVGLAWGTSYDAFYAKILQPWTINHERSTMISSIRWCMTDERINCEEKDRNDTHIWEVFLEPLCEMGFSQPEYFIRPGQNPPSEFQLSHHLSNFYLLPFPHLDIAFFWIGPDGHTASLFPHHEALNSWELWYIEIHNSPKPPPDRISLSPRSIQSLKHVCLFVVDENKKEALANFLDESVSIADCPARLLQPEIVFDATTNEMNKTHKTY